MRSALAQAKRYGQQVAQLENHGLIVESMQIRTAWFHFLYSFPYFAQRHMLRKCYDDTYWES